MVAMRMLAFKTFLPEWPFEDKPMKTYRRNSNWKASISFYFNHKIVEFMGTLKQNLMGYPGRYADHVADGKSSADTTLDRPVTFFVGADGLSIQQGTADQQRGCAGFDEENVCLSLMPLGRAIGFPSNQQGAVIGKVRNLLYRKMVRISGGIVVQFLVILFE
jgi:hypothetical protein